MNLSTIGGIDPIRQKSFDPIKQKSTSIEHDQFVGTQITPIVLATVNLTIGIAAVEDITPIVLLILLSVIACTGGVKNTLSEFVV